MSDMAQKGKGAPDIDPMSDTLSMERPPGGPRAVEGGAAPGNAVETFPSWPPGRTLAGRYTVLGLLGQGGMGVVLAAYDSRLDRRVALKLLHPKVGAGGTELEARMEREAQAMARLSHPNVVSVYDASTLEDGSILIAMEMVEGQTLRRWCVEAPRTWREILTAHVAAGHGLVAAHAAGLIHRDFKPDNVLVGRDGRVRVTDFGLARADSSPPMAAIPDVSAPPSPDAWERALTLPGTLVGTPRYMAPELSQGRPADARSDVFSFCVSLYEALYQQHPFPGDNFAELTRAQREGRVNPPPSQSEVPQWVARALLHGLQAEPERRPASMGELLAALEDDPEVRQRARRSLVLTVMAMVGLAGLAAWGWWQAREQGLGCGGMERKLAGTWEPAVKERMRQSFLGTGLPYAQDSFERVSTLLDGYAGAWVKARTGACEAGQQQAQRTRDLAVLQVYCLERRHNQLRALTELFSQGTDRESLPKAVLAVQSLPPLEYCADAKALMAAVPLPEDPVVRARVEVVQDQVAQLGTLKLAGKYREGLALGDDVLKQVTQVDYVPVRAHAMFQVASLRVAAGDYAGAEPLLRQAILLAAQSRELVLEANAWSQLISMMWLQARHQEALGLRLTVEAAIERAADERVRGVWLNRLGMVFESTGKYEEARVQFERALSILEKELGPEHPDVAVVLNSLARVSDSTGDYAKAKTLIESSLRIRQKALGPDHPDVASALSVLSTILWRMGRFEEAKARLERMRIIREKALGPAHQRTAIAFGKLGVVLSDLGQYDEAKRLAERSVSIGEKALGPEHPELAGHLNALGLVLQGMGQYEEARALHERALSICEKTLESGHDTLVESLTRLGRAQVRLGKFHEAHLHFERARSALEQAFGPTHPELGEVYLGEGELLLARNKPTEAVTPLEHALALAPGRLRAEVQFVLSQALWKAGQARPRALELATSAQKHYQDIANAPKLAEVSRWLETHTRLEPEMGSTRGSPYPHPDPLPVGEGL